ncbi:hypothetical protein HN709_04680 [Candidatus Peregrinibacteria bacterium]|jgi:hypothetical protein|nr:hypothetical protein [Candidatus Peregrinibacteria bacterium]
MPRNTEQSAEIEDFPSHEGEGLRSPTQGSGGSSTRATMRKLFRLIYSEPDESERRANSEQAKSGEMTVNRPRNEQIANLKKLRTLSLFQPSKNKSEREGGQYSYFRTLNYYLDRLFDESSRLSSFIIFEKEKSGEMEEKVVRKVGDSVFLGKEEIFPNQHQGRWRFPAPVLDDIAAYKVKEEGVSYMGIQPTRNSAELRDAIGQVVGENRDITMLQYRGHDSYGSGANIPEEVLDPAIVYLGGCQSSRFLEKAQEHHFRSGIVTQKHSTGWEINHHRKREVMRALKLLRSKERGGVNWGQLSDHLRNEVAGNERFSKKMMILPGDPHEEYFY